MTDSLVHNQPMGAPVAIPYLVDGNGSRPMIAEPLWSLATPIDAMRAHPRNPRQGDVGALTVSMAEFSQYQPIVVQRSTGYVIAGNHRWFAARHLGWKSIAVTYLDVDDETAVRILLADNRTSDQASYNESALADLLREIAQQDALAGTGYDGEDVDRIIADAERASMVEFSAPEEAARNRTEVARGNTQCTIGGYRFTIDRETYERWVEDVKMSAGFDDDSIVAEMRRRLGL